MQNWPYFIVESGIGQGDEIHVNKKEFIFGRDDTCDYAIRNEKISRQHTKIFIQGGKWMLVDLKSKNHTRLNNIKLASEIPSPLSDGDQIQLATQIVLRFYDPSATLSDDSRVVTNGLWIDTNSQDVYIHNKRIEPKLSPRNFNILVLLFDKSQSKSNIATLEEIAAVGWPGEYGISDTMIDSEIYRLRKRLEELGGKHEFICSERGRGKKFVQFGEN